MIKRFLLSLACLCLLSASLYAVDGYWVLESTKLSKDGGKNPATNKPYWRSLSKNVAVHNSGVQIHWSDPPEKIKFGDEANLGIQVSINRFEDPERSPAQKMITGFVTVRAMENGGTPAPVTDAFWWGDASYKSGVRSRHPDMDMQMDLFVPNRQSTLVIAIGGRQLAAVAGGSFNPAIEAAQYYYYKFVGDDPVYNYETEADDDPGEFGKTDIPPAVFWGPLAAIGGGIAVSRILKKRKKKKEQEGDDGPDDSGQNKQESPSSYRMVLYKEFGDSLRVGEQPKVVGARIEEIKPPSAEFPQGQRVDRPDLTKTILISEGQNIKVLATGMSGKYRSAKIQAADKSTSNKGSIIFSFKGPGGSLNNRVIFKILSEQELIFAQDNVTFVAGKNDTTPIYFALLGFGDKPQFDVKIERDRKNSFSAGPVRPHENHEQVWLLDLTDNHNATPEDIPGDMDNFDLTITAWEMLEDGTRRETTGTLPIHRFYEGLRLEVGHIKAYPVKKGTEDIYTTEQLPTADTKEVAIAHTRLAVTLFAWDKQTGEIGTPDPDSLKVVIEDVPDSLCWYGKKDGKIENPVSALGLDIKPEDKRPSPENRVSSMLNTFLFQIVPSAIMLSPNRCQAKISATATFQGRDFSAEQVSMVISMPARTGTNEELEKAAKRDLYITDDLIRMRAKLLSHPDAPQMEPLINKFSLLLESYHKRFGYDEYEYAKAKNLYLRYVNGEIGSMYVNESVFSWQEIYLGEAFDITMAQIEEKEPKTFADRLMLGIVTLGYSELLVFTPKSFLLTCKRAAEDKDAGEFWHDFKVGAKFGFDVGIEYYIMHKATTKLGAKLKTTQFGQACSELTRELATSANNLKQSLCKSYSTANYAFKFVDSANKILNFRFRGRARAKMRSRLDTGHKAVETSPQFQHLKRVAERAQKEGEETAKRFLEGIKSKTITQEELNLLTSAVQNDRFAKIYMNSSHVTGAQRGRFNMENYLITAKVQKALKKTYAKKFGVHESEVTFFAATGNKQKSFGYAEKVGMDFDHTDYIRGQSLPEEIANKYWNEEYYFQVTGKRAPSTDVANAFGKQAEQTAVSTFGPESFQNNLRHVLDPSLADQALPNAKVVRQVQTHKVIEPLEAAEQSAKEAFYCTDPIRKELLEKQALSNFRESCYQYTKGYNRTLDPKLKVIEQNLGGLEKNLDMRKVEATYNLYGDMEQVVARTKEGDVTAIIDMYAGAKAEGGNLSQEIKESFSLITDVDRVIQEHANLPPSFDIPTGYPEATLRGGFDEAFKPDDTNDY